MPSYGLTSLAEKDLKGIALYTIDTWGIKQTKHYEGLLSQCFQDIAEGKVTSRIFLKLRSDLLFTRCGHHYIFYYQPDGKSRPVILAVLHERMNMIQRLKERLGTIKKLFASPICSLLYPARPNDLWDEAKKVKLHYLHNFYDKHNKSNI